MFFPRSAISCDNDLVLITDASEVSGSSILFQTFFLEVESFIRDLKNNKSSWNTIENKIKNGELKAISCHSHRFNNTEKHYSAFNKN